MPKRAASILLLLIVALAVLLSLPYILEPRRDFDGDEAVTGLMALHATRGRIPVYYYGQGYMGSPEALLAGVYFLLLGPSASALKLAPFTFYLLFLLLQYQLIARYRDRSHALFTLALTAVFSPMIVLWATKARGGFTAVLFWGALGYLLFFRTMDTYLSGDRRRWRWAVLAALAAAVSFWHFALVIYYYLPVFLVIVRCTFREPEARGLFRSLGAEIGADLAWLGRRSRIWRWLAGMSAVLWAVWVIFALAALARRELVVEIAGARISSHHGLRDLFRALLAAGVALTAISLYRRGRRNFLSGLGSAAGRFFRSPPLVTALALVAVPAALLAAINWYFSLSPESGYGVVRPWDTLAGTTAPLVTVRLTFSRLIPLLLFGEGSFAGADRWLRIVGVVRVSLLSAAVVISAASVFPRLSSRLLSRSRRLEAFCLTATAGSLLILWSSGMVRDSASFRYLIPLVSWLPYLCSVMVIRIFRQSRAAGIAVGAFLFVSQAVHLLPVVERYGDLVAGREMDSVPEAIIQVLDEERVDRAWADYWLAYPVTFLSRERIIAAPFLSQDRYPPYTRAVEESGRKAYVFERNPVHQAALRELAARPGGEGRKLSFREAAGRRVVIISPPPGGGRSGR